VSGRGAGGVGPLFEKKKTWLRKGRESEPKRGDAEEVGHQRGEDMNQCHFIFIKGRKSEKERHGRQVPQIFAKRRGSFRGGRGKVGKEELNSQTQHK